MFWVLFVWDQVHESLVDTVAVAIGEKPALTLALTVSVLLALLAFPMIDFESLVAVKLVRVGVPFAWIGGSYGNVYVVSMNRFGAMYVDPFANGSAAKIAA